MSLKKQAVSGLIWTFFEQFGSALVSFAISVLLARLLQPSDFGVIALFHVVTGLATVIIGGGLASSLIRTNLADEKDYSTVFIFNIASSFVLYIIIYLTAPFVAMFYKLEILTNIIRVYCIILIINAFVTVQKTHFIKELNFKMAFKIQLPSLIVGGGTGVFLAYIGFGVWSLVYSAIIQSLVFMLQHWFYSDWRPKVIFDREKFKYHFNYGYKITLAAILEILFSNVYTIIIGKYFSIQQLGYYNRADSLKQLPVSNLSTALNKVSFPLFAKISHDNVKLKEVYQKMMGVVIFVIAPVLALMVVAAEPLIRFLLTEKWLPAVPYFKILSIAGLLYPINAYNMNVLKVKGKTDLFLKLEIIKKILTVAVVFIALKFGIYGLLWGQVFLSVLALFVNSFYTGKILKYNVWAQINDLVKPMFLATLVGGLLYLIDQILLSDLNDLFRLILLTATYTSIYGGIAFLFKFKEIRFIKELIEK
ncbi:capsule biosynthesis protein CapK [Kaistella solincola]|uniref:Capsule biosynthesis protein CapK n=1 Tax=Kaistella solincola TaxID=510955 RepID=A0ABR4ZQ50_9FLAO|nr:lipopolysaccharide biosynthesis protein [Kaistella solincola]KIA82871.1 capsule biosynthesis protein CapK [Kaistella solincola]